MNSTIGIDNLFIQTLVNVILYTVKKIERLVQQEKISLLASSYPGYRAYRSRSCTRFPQTEPPLHLNLHLSSSFFRFSGFLFCREAPRISSSVKITRQDPKFFALSTILLSLSAIAIQSIAQIWLQLPELFARVTSSCKWAIMQIWSVMTSYCLQLKCGKYWINDISGNIEAVFLKHGTINVHHKKKQSDTLSAVSIATLLAPVSFCQKAKKGSYLEQK